MEAEETGNSWKQYTEELYKKGLNDPDNHNGVITHLEPDILECEVKWALTAELRLGLRQGSCDMGWGAGLGRERQGA